MATITGKKTPFPVSVLIGRRMEVSGASFAVIAVLDFVGLVGMRIGSAGRWSTWAGLRCSRISTRGRVIDMDNLPLYDERAAARIISCSVALLRKWRLFREGPNYVKVGRLVRYRQEDLAAFLDSHRVVTGGGR
jgi:hypothetical protein